MRWKICLLLICWISLCVSSRAQAGLEVSYYAPTEQASGAHAATGTPYTLLCLTEHALFFKGQAESSTDFDEQQQRVVLNFATGDSWVYKDLGRSDMISLVSTIREDQYLVEEKLPEISWQLSSEKKSIQGIRVQKARGHFRGRDYTVWFAPGIPLPGGPWKLGGLPGLILEAYDDDRLVVFLFQSIRNREQLSVEPPRTRAPKVTLQEYQEISMRETRQYFKFLNGRLQQEGSGVRYEIDEFELWEKL